jgi:hypothetical protein
VREKENPRKINKDRRIKPLGSLSAVCANKIFMHGIIGTVNSFDQCGVELGKQLATASLQELKNQILLCNCNLMSPSKIIMMQLQPLASLPSDNFTIISDAVPIVVERHYSSMSN